MLTFLVALATAFVGSIPAAGPLAMLLASSAAAGDRKGALRLAVGGAVAESCWAVAATSFAPRVAGALRGLGTWLDLALAAVLLALGAMTLASPGRKDRPAARPAGVLIGFSLVALNPAFFLFWLSSWRFLDARLALVPSPPLVAAGAFVGVVAWFAVLTEISARAGSVVGDARLRVARRLVGGILVAMGLWMALSGLGVVARDAIPG